MRSPSVAISLLFTSVILQSGSPASAQPLAPPKAQIEAMKKLDALVGEWKGSGWSSTKDDGRREFNIVEKVQRKLGGALLLIEGRGTRKSDNDEVVVTHEALGLLSYDDKAKRYKFRAHDIRGQAIDVEPKLLDSGFEWGFKSEEGGVTIRFTIKYDDKRWHEVGEASKDGKVWHKFLEMTLDRVK